MAAEAAAGIELTAAIIEVTTFTLKVIGRLHEFREASKEIPHSLKGADAQLGLLRQILATIQRDIDGDDVDDEARALVQKVLDDCRGQVLALDGILQKLLPSDDDSRWRRAKKAFVSVRQDKAMREILQKLQHQITLLTLHQSTTATQPSAPSAGKEASSVWMVPFERDPHFVGREAILSQIDERFRVQRKVTIAGMGGVGKSQVAIEYCYRFRNKCRYGTVLWIHAGTSQRVVEAFNSIAQRACLPGWDDPACDKLSLVQDWLGDASREPWLLVIDNADDENVFFDDLLPALLSGTSKKRVVDFLPHHTHGYTLITTRDRSLGAAFANQAAPIRVTPFSIAEAEEFVSFKLGAPDITPEISALCELLEYVPLALSQASAYIMTNFDDIGKYLDLLKSDEFAAKLLTKEMPDLRRDRESLNAIGSTLMVSFRYIRTHEPRAIELLQLMSCFDRQGVPEVLLRKDEDNVIEYEEALGCLRAFSLVTAEKSGRAYQMHRLVQRAMQQWMVNDNSLGMWEAKALEALLNAYPRRNYDFSGQSALEPHVQAIQKHKFTDKSSELHLSRLYCLAQNYSSRRGDFPEALKRSERALELYQRHFDEDDERMSLLIHDLGVAHVENQNYLTAESLLTKAIALRSSTHGPDDSNLLRSKTVLCNIYSCLQKDEEAELLQVDVCERLSRTSGERDISWIAGISNLASIHANRQDYEKALPLASLAFHRAELLLGNDNPYTLDTLQKLAEIHANLEHYPDATEMYLKALVIVDDAHTGSSDIKDTIRCNLYYIYFIQEKYQDALNIQYDALAEMTRIYGPTNPSILEIKQRIVDALKLLYRFDEALIHMQDIVENYQNVQGPIGKMTVDAEKSLSELKELKLAADEKKSKGVRQRPT